MDQQKWTCPQCSRVISPDDSVVRRRGGLSHLDCQRPRVLTAEERLLLFTYCQDHRVACITCSTSLYLYELGRHTHRCPWCRSDLTDSVRDHLYDCATLPEKIRRRAKAVREAARTLVKQSHQLRDKADVVMREAEAAVAALRETMHSSRNGSPRRETEYKGWRIEPQSYETDRARWCPKVLVRSAERGTVHTHIVLGRVFRTKQDADAYASKWSRELIDNYGSALT